MCQSHVHLPVTCASQAQTHACIAGGQWLPDMKELAGGRDDWQQPGDAPERITWEAIRRYAPEVLLLCPCSSNLERSLGEVCSLAAQPGWWALPAVKAGRVYICDHSLFSRPGPRSPPHPAAVQQLLLILLPNPKSLLCFLLPNSLLFIHPSINPPSC